MPPNVYKSDLESSDDDVDDDDETPRRPLKLTAREARAKKGGRGKEPAKRKRKPKKYQIYLPLFSCHNKICLPFQ